MRPCTLEEVITGIGAKCGTPERLEATRSLIEHRDPRITEELRGALSPIVAVLVSMDWTIDQLVEFVFKGE